MIPTDNTQRLDNALLIELYANNTLYGLPASALRPAVREHGGGCPSESEVVDRLEYLTGKNLVVEIRKTVHVALRAWKITDAGRRYIDENNL